MQAPTSVAPAVAGVDDSTLSASEGNHGRDRPRCRGAGSDAGDAGVGGTAVAWSLLHGLCVAFLNVEEIDNETANGRGRILAELVFLLTVVLFVFMLFLPMWKFCQSKTAPHDGVVQAADDDSTRW